MCPKTRLSTRVKRFVDMLQACDDTKFSPPNFWPSWINAHIQADASFTADEKKYVKDLLFQSFDRDGFFTVLKIVEGSATPGSSPPTRSNFFPKMNL